MNRLSLDTVTIRYANLEDKFRLASQAGFRGIELWGEDIDTDVAVREVLRLLGQYPLIVEGICPQPDLYRWHYVWDKELQVTFRERLQRYHQIGANYIALAVMSEDGGLQETAENLNRLGELAQDYGIKLALEPVGHIKKLARIKDAVCLLEQYQAEADLGLILDAFHFFRGGNQLSDIRLLNPKKILSVHINDAMNLPMERLVGYKHRLYPGEGIFDVRGFCAVLQNIGYTGPFIVELLNERYWKTDPAIVAMKAYKSAQNVL